MNILEKITGLAAFTALSTGSLTAGSPIYEKSYKDALSKAEKKGKPVIVIFSATWCPPCQANKKDVYPSYLVAEYRDKFVWTYLDIDQAENKTIAGKYGVNGIPHIQFLDKTGKSVGKSVGGTTPKDFAAVLKGILAKTK